ncbi:FAD-dependent oxidoreductase [Amycolatopsis sp. WQ 127309]|uniref:FAD-dependent oxidoreductase n=1 Tax=Amycolatopsis sp. WQ 127309 TaxID=2932773 RepID=UPI001FF4B31E|nr:FAD-dependent oxidoreductase [Amycolatopsis sp. WQ 127309]UOZ06985.1 FAD-dependent oxidoreductase [Amycolatopsis sp. WQ 127309]
MNAGLVVASGPEDPRLYDIDDDFRQVLIDLSGLVAYSARHGTRFLHPASIGARGTLRVVADPAVPAQDFFRPGRVFPVLGRYSNSQGADDHEVSVRGLSLRLLGDESAGLLDLTFNTGEVFFAPDASSFRDLTAGSAAQRDQVLDAQPRLRTALWDTERVAVSYATYELHSQAPRVFTAADGSRWLARYRVRPADEPVRPGHYDHGTQWWPPTPPEAVARPAEETGAPTALRDELRDRLSGGGFGCVLQIRLRPVEADPRRLEDALDATKPWPGEYRWTDLARIRFDEPLPDETTDALAFDPALAPAGFGVALARSPRSTASLGHLRALIYRMTSLARLGKPLPPQLAGLLRPPRHALAPRTVCVIGAGPAGLTAARELERAGHRVIVLEAAGHVGGKATSVDVDRHPHDLGAHICTGRYRTLAALAAELGVGTEPTPAELVLSTGSSGRTTTDMRFFTDGSVERYEALRAARFPRIGEPGLAHSAAALAAPLSEWLAENDLQAMYTTFGLGYTSAGYGFPDDDLPALYFVKYAETTGLLSDTVPSAEAIEARFTVKGGFGALWERVAEDLADVRVNTTVLAVTRHDTARGGVVVRTDRGVVEADDLVIAVPPDRIAGVLDASAAEHEVARRVRYQGYRTTVATATGLPQDAFYLLGEFADSSVDRGHCVGFQHRYPGSDVYTCYSYLGEDTAGQLERDLAACGAQDFRAHLHRDWFLMPHFTSADVRAGVLEDLEARQGERHTYFTGGVLGFESVECAMSHALDLVHRAFPGRDAAAAAAGEPQRPVGRTSGEIRAWLVRSVAEATAGTAYPRAPLSELPLGSLALAGLMSDLSTYLGFRVPHTLFLQLPTIDAVAGYLAEGEAPFAAKRVRETFSPGVRPFFCVGGIGASGAYLRPLAASLGPERPLLPFEIPGRLDGTGAPLDDVETIAEAFVEQIKALSPEGPYRIGGHSFGGVVAYEIGRQLRAAGAEVSPVLLLDTFVAVAGQQPPDDDVAGALRDQAVVRHMACLATGTCDCGIDFDAPLAGQRDALARALGATEPARYDEHLAAIVEVQLSSLHAYASYAFPPSDLTVHVLKTVGGFAPMPSAHFGLKLHLDSPANGWEHVDVAKVRVFPVSGNHFSMFVPPHVTQVAGAIEHSHPDGKQTTE